MQLLERDKFLELLERRFNDVLSGEGHCVFISGEAGIGKTSLLRAFSRLLPAENRIFRGSCDALFTPRPLAPLFDIGWQIRGHAWNPEAEITDRSALFSGVFQDLSRVSGPFVILFEDIHWADEATLDFIKFLARRIVQLPCLFLLTYREDEIHGTHPLRNVLGHLPPDAFSRMQLQPLSLEAVSQLAAQKGFDGKQVFSITGGNPFYVNEVLESYSPGIPQNIRDSILSVYNRQPDITKRIWNVLSIIPAGLETTLLAVIDPEYINAVQDALDVRILIEQAGKIHFKHELYRRTIEGSLSPLLRVSLNQRILDLFKDVFEAQNQPERIIHHAKNANDYALVQQFAPVAARDAAKLGAHVEAGKLYLTAIECYQDSDKTALARLYDGYAYECYLTNQVKEAIIYTGKSLPLYKLENNVERMGASLRFLSRLWWFEGNWQNAETYGCQAVDLLESQPASSVKAMAYSNMSQLKMLSDQISDCFFWGNKAIDMATDLKDEETLAHAMNNVGTVQMRAAGKASSGRSMLEASLEISLKNNFHEHVARAYTNLSASSIALKDYESARHWLTAGIQYSDERDLYSWKDYMLSWMSRLLLETGEWKEAHRIAMTFAGNEKQSPVVRVSALVVAAVVRMRQGQENALALLNEGKNIAFLTTELQRTLPVLSAMMEYEWLHEVLLLTPENFEIVFAKIGSYENEMEKCEFFFWLKKTGRQDMIESQLHPAFDDHSADSAQQAAACWREKGNPYYENLLLSAAYAEDKKNAIRGMESLGATAVIEKLKKEMRAAGVKSIPRGMRKSTETNPAFLTSRELEVLSLLKEGLQNKEIAARLFLSAKTIDHHISSILFKLEVNSRTKAVQEALRRKILK